MESLAKIWTPVNRKPFDGVPSAGLLFLSVGGVVPGLPLGAQPGGAPPSVGWFMSAALLIIGIVVVFALSFAYFTSRRH